MLLAKVSTAFRVGTTWYQVLFFRTYVSLELTAYFNNCYNLYGFVIQRTVDLNTDPDKNLVMASLHAHS